MNQHCGRFQQLLRELFQFDCADLDFGIYRIINHKRDVIEKFITDDLPKIVAKELEYESLRNQEQLASKLEEVVDEIRDTLGRKALDPEGNLAEKYIDTPLGRKYQDLKAKISGARGRKAIETSIFNHLYKFFGRYYQDGDFISKRRYSKSQKYAIPYNGEEVYLYWANNDQYYIKTAEHFHDYTFKSLGVTVHFKMQAANVEQNNVKGAKRFFLPCVKSITWNEKTSQIVVPFEYRPLNNQEEITYGNKKQQDFIIAKVLVDVPRNLKDIDWALKALMGKQSENDNGEPISIFEYHLRQYTRRNMSDFFIHKSLKNFLSHELDFYIKNEVLNIDDVEIGGENHSEIWFQTLRIIRSIGSQIIDFLSQIEEFQKMLFEKRKFIIGTQYCITVGNINENFYPDIATRESQWTEWKELLHIDEEDAPVNLDERSKFLRSHPTLFIDTKHFDQSFVDRLLNDFDDIDGITDGLLIHSENWQALNLLKEKYTNHIQCIYIDPPYNTAASEIIYKNGYKHSSWLTLMANRLISAASFLDKDAAWVVAIDDTEMVALSQLLDSIFPEYDRNMVVVNHHPAGSGLEGTNVSSTHEYAVFMSPKGLKVLRGEKKEEGYQEIAFVRTGTAGSNLRSGRPNSFYAFLVDPSTSEIMGVEPPPPLGEPYPKDKTEEGFIRIYPLSNDGTERVWRRSHKTIHACLEKGEVICKNSKSIYLITDQTDKRRPLFSNWTDTKYNAGEHGTNLLKKLFGSGVFSYPKSINTVRDCIDACIHSTTDATVLDYFAGSATSGHAVINLNREDGGQRKFILVEMGEYFDTVLLPRIKKVVFTPEWKDGMPQRIPTPEEIKHSPRIIKYIQLESYEDALNNIEFDDLSGQQVMEFEDYLLQYMLKWETRRSQTLLNVEKLIRPFCYKLHIHSDGHTHEEIADIPETFNYLLGLHVQTRQVLNDGGNRYLVYRGWVENRQVVVIWRETEGWGKAELKRDKEFVAEKKLTEGADDVRSGPFF